MPITRYITIDTACCVLFHGLYSDMAAVFDRTQIGIKKIGSTTTVPDNPIARLMYYFDCVCSCTDADDDASIRRLRNYRNYLDLTNDEEAKLFILCLALSPDKLIGSIFFPDEDIDGGNKFYELSAVNTKLVVSESVMVGGQQKRVHKIMKFKKIWIERNYLEPLQSFQQRQRPAIRSPPQRQRSNDSDCIIL